jgi:DHA2 family multidrug resistance protein
MQVMLGFTATQAGLAMMPRSLIMLVVMPIVGRLFNKVSPRLIVAFGILMFCYSAWLMSRYTLATTARGVVTVLLIQGVAFSCLFIPLTTVALSSIPRARMTDATGLNSLLRQVGGSVGLAIFATMLSRSATRARGSLISHIVPGNTMLLTESTAMRKLLAGHGFDAVASEAGSMRLIDYIVRQQSMVLSFEKLFLIAGISFACVLPLVFLLRMPKRVEKTDVHMEM